MKDKTHRKLALNISWELYFIVSLVALTVFGGFFKLVHHQDPSPAQVKYYSLNRAYSQIANALYEFQKKYNAMPGDMIEVEKLPKCKEMKCNGGDGNGVIGNGKFEPIKLYKDERHLFWLHLYYADLLPEYKPSEATTNWAGGYEVPTYKSALHVYTHLENNKIPGFYSADKLHPNRTYLILSRDRIGDLMPERFLSLTPAQAKAVDKNFDEGDPFYGVVQAGGKSDCINQEDRTKITYNTNIKDKCLYLIVQLEPRQN